MAYGPQARPGGARPRPLAGRPVQPGRRRPAADERRSPPAARPAGVDGYLYADRGIYRPGETVHLVGPAARPRGRARSRTARASLVIRRPSGVELPAYRASTGAPDGAVGRRHRPAARPRRAAAGRATLEIDGLDEPAGELTFAVEDFAPQRLAVERQRPTRPGPLARRRDPRRRRHAPASSTARPAPGLQTQGEARLRADPNPFPQFKDYRWGDEQTPVRGEVRRAGRHRHRRRGPRGAAPSTPTAAGDTPQPLEAALTASVFEPGGRPVREGADAEAARRAALPGRQGRPGRRPRPATRRWPSTSSPSTPTAAASPAPGVTWTLIAENWDYDWFQQDGRWQWRRTSRDAVVAARAR